MHKSPLHDIHIEQGAKLIDFAGWHMPVHYRGINEEHVHTRTKCSIFDVSHMGRIRIQGTGAQPFLQHICTRDLDDTQVGQNKYSHICNEQGGVIDDVIVGRYKKHWYVVCNASNRESVLEWMNRHCESHAVKIVDETFETAMLAIQGPKAIGFVEDAFGLDIKSLKRYWALTGSYFGMQYTIARSGYTGEDGVEAIVPASAVGLLVPLLLGGADREDNVCMLAGLAARDTLRLEAGMPLYGHELSLEWDSLTAGQGWCVDLSKDFIGAAALREIKAGQPTQKLVGLELDGKRIAREGYPILKDSRPAGKITSGTMSPTLGKSIAMGFVETEFSEPGTELEIDLGRKTNPARVVPLPFYKRPKSN